LEDGTVLGWLLTLIDRDRRDPMWVGSRSLHQPLRLFPGDTRVDTLPGIEVAFPTIDGVRIPLAVSFALALDSRGHIWFNHGSQYRLFRRTIDGDTLLAVSLEGVQPARISESEVDSIVRGFREAAASLGLPRRQLPRAGDLPAYRPAISRLLVDDSGHVLVFPSMKGYLEGSVMDVFSETTGEYLGRVELPVQLKTHLPAWAGPGLLYLVSEDENGVHRIVRVDLIPAQSSAP
jgi:hypothetical protein